MPVLCEEAASRAAQPRSARMRASRARFAALMAVLRGIATKHAGTTTLAASRTPVLAAPTREHGSSELPPPQLTHMRLVASDQAEELWDVKYIRNVEAEREC
eukprot:CAMPEP_0181182928 /NCGR_PEP_ID=MMETSP1096-20121128/8148_1 /TAXON_ID=156174 ORGANISM="Chrysochromulina ericina, Strain CCMP281" /NCGR_SAMPLE_ID=MMETSP1096 /ASSEMBLY_ACC=CAM_ASM_000453 /LENGTH=101 /DNA_ID=CAMNT_0023271563 /DNA_START=249 /DNA_END=555 /DNA_ORIENTATION=-